MTTKTKNTAKKRAKLIPKSTKRSIRYVHAKKPILKHLRLIENKHSFKLVHHCHTSHIILIITLLLLGFLLFAGSQLANSYSTSNIVNIGARVNGLPPSVGALINSPDNGDVFTENEVRVSGTCQPSTFVVIRDNGLTVGSTDCTSAGVFSLIVQLENGVNVLSALNYDNLNQTGPETSAVSVRYEPPVENNPIEAPVEEVPQAVIESSPINPSIIPDLAADASECINYKASDKLPTGGPPRVSVVCVPRLFLPRINQVMGLIVWGGNPPYAINIDWGDESIEPTLLSVSEPGYKTVKFSYKSAGSYSIFLRMIDENHETAISETATVVNGQPETNQPIASIVADIVDTAWFKASVPLYFIAFAVTIGFWCGDIFERKLNNCAKPKRRSA